MARYTIDRPGNVQVDVRRGKIFKKRAAFFNQWPWIKISTEVRTGYILTVENVVQKIKTGYYLLKTNEGKWFDKTDYELSPIISKGGKLQPLTNDLITPAIKKAIDDHENKQ